MRIAKLSLVIGLLPIVLAASKNPLEFRTDCQNLLVGYGRYGAIKEGFEEISFHADGVTQGTDAATAIRLSADLMRKMTEVLQQAGLEDQVLFAHRDYSSSINILALELLAKGVSTQIVDEFHPNWKISEPHRHIFWDIRDPLYLILKYQVRRHDEWLDIWVKTESKYKILVLLRQNLPEGVFLNKAIRRGGPGHIT